MRPKIIALCVVSFGVLASACTTTPNAAIEPNAPVGMATCVEGATDCQDIVVEGDVADPGADGLEVPGPGAGMIVDGGLSIDEAMASAGNAGIAVGEPFAVGGFLVVTDGEARLCEALAESYPPQCGGRSLRVDGDVSEYLTQAEGSVSWNDNRVVLLGSVTDGETLTLVDAR